MPAPPSRFRFTTGSDVQQALANGSLPRDFDDLAGEKLVLGPKQRGIVQTPDDVMELAWCGGGAMGDPLDRPSTSVAGDVTLGRITPAWAERVYGVVLTETGDVDEAATLDRRIQIRAGRHAPAREPGRERSTRDGFVWDVLAWHRDDAGSVVFECAACGELLSTKDDPSYKAGAVLIERELDDALPNTNPPSVFVDEKVTFREFACPGCARLLATEVARPGDAFLDDIVIA
jgi:N-methylhydantoinase B